MARLIDANVLEQIFLDESRRLRKQIINDEVSDEEANYIRSFMPTIEWARKTVHGCATVDAVEVVYCMDCARCKKGFCTIRKDSWGATLKVGLHDFCSDGERRSNEAD